MEKLYELYCTEWNHNFNTFTQDELKHFKNNLTKNEIDNMKKLVEEMFNYKLLSVTYDRPDFVSHLNKHQYFSTANYWWANPETKDGLPFIRKDGYLNPDSIKWCKDSIRKIGFIIMNSSLLYYFTNDKKYYELMKKQINNFFINEDTYMLPNIEYAQMIAGHPTDSNGRKTGIMDLTSHLGYALCMFKNLYNENLIEEELFSNLKKWVKQLICWLETSKVAIDESNEKNNHGTMFTLFITQLYYFTDELEGKKESIKNKIDSFLVNQILEDGSMPLELDRTRSVAYTTMNLKAFIDTYKLLGVDYSKNKLLKKSFEFILPVLNNEKCISDIKIIDNKTNEIKSCVQIEGTYLEAFKCYLKFIGKNFDLEVKLNKLEDVVYAYFLK